MHSDLPTTDYSSLFDHLRREGKLLFGNTVYSCVVAESMYEQLSLLASTQIAMSFNAIGFLNRRPLGRLPDYIVPNGPSQRRDIASHNSGSGLMSLIQSATVQLSQVTIGAISTINRERS